MYCSGQRGRAQLTHEDHSSLNDPSTWAPYVVTCIDRSYPLY